MKRSTLSALFVAAALTVLAAPAFAQMDPAAGNTASGQTGLIAIGIAILMGLAVLGGTLGQSKVAALAVEGTARNPAAGNKILVPLILGLALIESLVLFAFLIANGMAGSFNGLMGHFQKN